MPSVTLTTVATAAAQFLGVLDSGESLSAQQLADALAACNNLLENWTNEQTQLMKLTLQTFALAGGTYTPGAVLQFANATTPITIPVGYLRAVELGLAIELAAQYDAAPSATLVATYKEARAAANPVASRLAAEAPAIKALAAG